MKGLTKRQSEILDYIQEYISNHHYSPSYREIMENFKLSSLATIAKHIQVLKRKGALSNESGTSRSLRPTELPQEVEIREEIELPFIGHISSDEPIETFSKMQTLPVPDFLVNNPDSTYILRAKGNSLHELLIADSDLIIVEAKPEANPGDTIIGTTLENKAFIKKYYPEGNYIRLEGGPLQSPAILKTEDFTLTGVVTGILRLFS